MAAISNLVLLLNLDAKDVRSPFPGRHRNILITRDFTNTGDFAFKTLLQHFGSKRRDVPLLLITLSQNWSTYSAVAAKCGYNLIREENKGNIQVADFMTKWLTSMQDNEHGNFDPITFIEESISSFLHGHDLKTLPIRPVVVLIDDITVLLSLGCTVRDVYRLFTRIDKLMRTRSDSLPPCDSSHLIVQLLKPSGLEIKNSPQDYDLSSLISNIHNHCEILLSLEPLKTGYSTKVDGTIRIIDRRLPDVVEKLSVSSQTSRYRDYPSTMSLRISNTLSSRQGEIGAKKCYFFKVTDRKVTLTSNALTLGL